MVFVIYVLQFETFDHVLEDELIRMIDVEERVLTCFALKYMTKLERHCVEVDSGCCYEVYE